LLKAASATAVACLANRRAQDHALCNGAAKIRRPALGGGRMAHQRHCASRLACVVAAALIAVPAASPASAQTLAELAMYSGPDRMARLIAGAKKEGVLNVYSSMTVGDMKVVVTGFMQRYGVKIQPWRASSESILQRTMIEHRAGRHEVDAIETSAAEMESLHREKLLQEVKSPHLADIVPGARRPHREWVGDRFNVIAAGYNTRLVRKDELPKTYEDFLDPRWKGRLGIESDDDVWFGALANAMGEAKAVKLFRDMVRINGMSVRKGHTLLANLVVSGEVPFALTLYHYKAKQLKRDGAPLDWYVIPPGFARFLGTGVMKRAPHPHAAVLFLDFMLHDAQQLLVKRDFTPTNRKVQPLDVDVNVIDPARSLDEGDKWKKLYGEIVVKQGKRK
jgi:iron(III) transport system substrate-binding protein